MLAGASASLRGSLRPVTKTSVRTCTRGEVWLRDLRRRRNHLESPAPLSGYWKMSEQPLNLTGVKIGRTLDALLNCRHNRELLCRKRGTRGNVPVEQPR